LRLNKPKHRQREGNQQLLLRAPLHNLLHSLRAVLNYQVHKVLEILLRILLQNLMSLERSSLIAKMRRRKSGISKN
jgi:hypothetical protein